MAELKRNFLEGKMNKDADERLVPDGQYRDALNIEISTSENNNKGVVQTLNGNVELTPPAPTSAKTTVSADAISVGHILDQSNGLVYNFISKAKNLTGTPATGIISDAIVELRPNKNYLPGELTNLTFTPVITDVYEARYQSDAFNSNVIKGLPTTEVAFPNGPGFFNLATGVVPGMRVQAIATNGLDLWAGSDVRVTELLMNGWVKTTTNPGYTSQNITDDVVLRFTKDRFLNFQQGTSELEANVSDGTGSSRTPNGNLITGINIVEDFLLFTDGRNEPKKVNIKRSKAGTDSLERNTILYIEIEGGLVESLPSFANFDNYVNESHLTVIRLNPNSPLKVETFSENSTSGSSSAIVTGNVAGGSAQGPYGQFKLADAANVAYQVGAVFYIKATGVTANYAPNTVLKLNGATSATYATIIITDYYSSSNTYRVKLQYIDPSYDPSATSAEFWTTSVFKTDSFYNEKFVYFAYRYIYSDNERSCISPYSTAAFLPTTYSYSPKDGFNLGMQNVADEFVIKDFVPSDIPKDVVEVELLIRTSESENVYLFRTVKIDSDEWLAPGTGSNRGVINITSEQSGSTLPSSQALRSFDAVPKRALAQEFSAGRLIYGNYYQDYNLQDAGGSSIKPIINTSAESQPANFTSAPQSSNNYSAQRNLDVGTWRQSFRTIANGISQASQLGTDNENYIYASKRGIYCGVDSLSGNEGGSFNIDGVGTNADPYEYYYTAPTTGEYTYNIEIGSFYYGYGGIGGIFGSYMVAIYECNTSGEIIIPSAYPFATAPTPIWFSNPQVALDVDNNVLNIVPYNPTVTLEAGKHYQVFMLGEFPPSGLNATGDTVNFVGNGLSDMANSAAGNATGVGGSAALNSAKISITSSPSTTNTLPSLAGLKSVKSERPYQVGVVYRDKYGRESSVLIDETNNFELPKALSSNSNKLVAEVSSNAPYWADTYKFFVKETSNRYYNLVMDSAFSVNDGVFAWLIFNSSDRNKVKVGDFLNLKKKHNTSEVVTAQEASWKVIDIENEGAIGEDGVFSAGSATSIATSSVASASELIGKFFVKVNYNADFTTYIGSFDTLATQGFVNANGAVFETRSSQELDLDLYYEVGKSYPIRLTERSAEQYISVGDKISLVGNWVIGSQSDFDQGQFYNEASALFQAVLEASNTVVTSVQGAKSFPSTQVEPNVDPSSYCRININHNGLALYGGWDNLLLQGFVIQFTKPDGSFVTARLVGSINGGHFYVIPYTAPVASAGAFVNSTNRIGIPWYNCISFGNGVESDTIKDDFNAPSIFQYVASGKQSGFKASLPVRNYKELHESNKLIYSQIYNEDSEVNRLNQFLAAENIVKKVNPENGSIQKLFSRDTNLVIFCESKVFGGPINKDIIFNADGNGQLITSNKVIGTLTPYSGDYGISTNPESFASDEFRIYFTDKDQGAVLRLSRDGITPIHEYGMVDWFSDNLKSAQALVGSFDDKKGEYNLTVHNVTNPGWKKDVYTLSFDEAAKGWVCFKSFIPEQGFSLNNQFFTFKNGDLYLHHYAEVNRNKFYGVDNNSSVTSIFNDAAGTVKSFNALSYEGTQAQIITDDGDGEYFNEFNNSTVGGVNLTERGWYAEYVNTDQQEGQVDTFIEKEGKWFNYIKGLATNYTNVNDGSQIANNLDTHEFSVQGIGQLSDNATESSGNVVDAYNLTFNNSTYASFGGEWVTNGVNLYGITSISGTSTFEISPTAGFTLNSANFSNTGTDSQYSSITFANSGTANASSNTVIATINWNTQAVTSNGTIDMTIVNNNVIENGINFSTTVVITDFYPSQSVFSTDGIAQLSLGEVFGQYKLSATIPAGVETHFTTINIAGDPGFQFDLLDIPYATVSNVDGLGAVQTISSQIVSYTPEGNVDSVQIVINVTATEETSVVDGFTIPVQWGTLVPVTTNWLAGDTYVIEDDATTTQLGIYTNGGIPTIQIEAGQPWLVSAVVDTPPAGQSPSTVTVTTTANTGSARDANLTMYPDWNYMQTAPLVLNFQQSGEPYINIFRANVNTGEFLSSITMGTFATGPGVNKVMVNTNGLEPSVSDFTIPSWLTFSYVELSEFQPSNQSLTNWWVYFDRSLNETTVTRTGTIAVRHNPTTLENSSITIKQLGSYDATTDTVFFCDISGNTITNIDIPFGGDVYTGYLNVPVAQTLEPYQSYVYNPSIQINLTGTGDMLDLWDVFNVTSYELDPALPYTHTYQISMGDNTAGLLNNLTNVATLEAYYQDSAGGYYASNNTSTPNHTMTWTQAASPFGYFVGQNLGFNTAPSGTLPPGLSTIPASVSGASTSIFGPGATDGVSGWQATFGLSGVNLIDGVDYTSVLFDKVGYWADSTATLKFIEGTLSNLATTWSGAAAFSASSHPTWLTGVVVTAPTPSGNSNGIVKFSIADFPGAAGAVRYASVGLFTGASTTIPAHVFHIVQYDITQ